MTIFIKKTKVFPWSAEICSARQNATFHNRMLHFSILILSFLWYSFKDCILLFFDKYFSFIETYTVRIRSTHEKLYMSNVL